MQGIWDITNLKGQDQIETRDDGKTEKSEYPRKGEHVKYCLPIPIPIARSILRHRIQNSRKELHPRIARFLLDGTRKYIYNNGMEVWEYSKIESGKGTCPRCRRTQKPVLRTV
jgi:hypothetical protein